MANELHAVAETDLILTATLVLGNVAINAGFMVESASIPGFYTGSVPGGTEPGSYSVLVRADDVVVATGVLNWDGAAEVTDLDTGVRVRELHLIHGLETGIPLSVSNSQRRAGDLVQELGQAGGTTTVNRVA